MEQVKSKILAQITAGMFGGTTIGIAGFVTLLNYGGNYGCWPFIDTLFNGAGYESCGPFGALTGLILGAILGVTIITKIKMTQYSKAALLLAIASFVLPFLYGFIMFWPPFGDDDLFIVPPVVLAFVIASLIPSVLITAAMHWENILRKIK